MTYLINEIFYTIQGEGVHTGQAAVFVRFSRCNLWTGREEERHKAICKFCDTDFLKVTYRFSPEDLVDAIQTEAGPGCDFIVFTGGEPSLQLDAALVHTLRNKGFYIAVETNGTHPLPVGINWICVSPKAGTTLHVTAGNELKLVYPQDGIDPAEFEGLAFSEFWLSPMHGPNLAENTAASVEYVLAHPQWRLNIQTHKVIGVR